MVDSVDIANSYSGCWIKYLIQTRKVKSSVESPSLLDVGSGSCVVCENIIPNQRRKALPGVRLCVDCQEGLEWKWENLCTGLRMIWGS